MKLVEGICSNCESIIDFTGCIPFSYVKCKKCSTTLVVPVIFGKFHLMNKLTENTLFIEYEGYDVSNQRNVILLTLNNSLQDHDRWLTLCKTEAAMLKNFDDDSIHSLTSFGVVDNTFYIATSFIDCFDMTEYDPNNVGDFEVSSIIDFMKKFAVIIEHLHSRNIEHHNIVPENIIVNEQSHIMLRNLFISRVTYVYESELGIKSSTSPYYISPEKAGKGTEGKKGDVFSFGVLIYYLFTGKYPFDGESESEIIYSRVKKRGNSQTQVIYKVDYLVPIDLIELRPHDLEPELSDLISSMLQAYPIQRPAIPEVIDALLLLDVKEDQKKINLETKAIVDSCHTQKIPMMKPFER